MAKDTVWKTKEKEGKKFIICQNSNPELSKYPEWGPKNGVCDEWSEMGPDTTASTCWRCAARSVSGMVNFGSFNNDYNEINEN
jgi:hypothetical protein|tara:strand:- start:1061 stop:1309 length:249 start_codon:yes stop_codon:yes gene_type:complete